MARDYIGLRVARWRDIAGMTQEQLAQAVGVTRGYISMIENGHKAITKRALLYDLAWALGVSPTDLTAQPYEPADHGDRVLYAAVPLIRVALDGSDDPSDPRPVAVLQAEMDAARRARTACDFPRLAELFPGILADAVLRVESGDTDALSVLVQACVGAQVLKSLGWVDLGARLAERAVAAANILGDPAHIAAAAFTQAQTVLAVGGRRRSLAIAESGLQHVLAAPGNDAASWAGMLHLHASLVAASLGQTELSADHLDAAAQIAPTVHGDPWCMEFTPANVAIWRVGIALENGEADRAPEYARLVDITQIRTAHRRARLHIDTARGHFAAGNRDGAISEFLTADAVSPIEVRNRPSVVEIVGNMVREAPRSGGSEGLRQLAARLRIDPLAEAA